jgi:hypothetical protein
MILASIYFAPLEFTAPTQGPTAIVDPVHHKCSFLISQNGSYVYVKNATSGTIAYVANDTALVIRETMASNMVDCLGKGLFNIQSQILAMNLTNFWIDGSGPGTVLQAGSALARDDVIKFYSCDGCGLANFKLVGFGAGTSGGGVSIQFSARVRVYNAEISLAPDNGIWITASHDVQVWNSVLDWNGNPYCSCVQNHGGIEIDTNQGANWNISVINSIAHNNYGPGFSVHNVIDGFPNTGISFINDTSYDNKNYSGSAINGVGFGAFDWNNTRFVNIRTYGNQYAGVFINGNTNGPLLLSGVADDNVPLLVTSSMATPEEVFIQLGR